MNNIPQVAQSLGGGESEPALFVMIMSTTNAIGRMFAAAGSDGTDGTKADSRRIG